MPQFPRGQGNEMPNEFKVKNGLITPSVTATGTVSGSELTSTLSSGDEGGQINLSIPATNTTLTTGVTIDVYQNKLRFFEAGGTNRGFYIDISGGGASAATNLVGGGGGSGTVTSVAQSFTGGLISVSGSPVTTTGTLALTVAGTSGGIPYFSSASTWASSAALAANALVIGGGAGAAPSTVTTGTGVVTALGVNTGTAGAFVVNGGALGTPSSGTVTNLTGTASININGTVGATTANTGAFTSITSTSASGILTRAAATQDGVALIGRAGGTGSFDVALTPTTLTADRTITLPDANINFTTGLGVAQGGTGATTLTGIIKGNGTSAFTAATAGTDYAAPGSTTTYTIVQNFAASGITLKGSSTGTTTFASANASATNYTITFPASTGTVLTTATAITVAQGGTGATTLTGVLKGNGTSAFTAATAGTDYVAPGTATTFTATQTFKGITETVFTITDGASVDINPANGTVQVWTLGANRTPTASSFAAGQSVLLMIDDGTARTITWSTIAVTWKTSNGTAPTLSTTGYTPIMLWKVGTTVYGSKVGSV